MDIDYDKLHQKEIEFLQRTEVLFGIVSTKRDGYSVIKKEKKKSKMRRNIALRWL
jgi:GTP-binding protein EngB required for normal cell division